MATKNKKLKDVGIQSFQSAQDYRLEALQEYLKKRVKNTEFISYDVWLEYNALISTVCYQ